MIESLRRLVGRFAAREAMHTQPSPVLEEVTGEAGAKRTQRTDEEATHYRELARDLGLRYAEASELLPDFDAEVCRRLDSERREKHRVIPIALDEAALVVASDQPGRAEKRLRNLYGVEELEYVVVTPTAFARLQWVAELTLAEGTSAPEDLLTHDVAHQPVSVAVFETILMEAAAQRASDVHLENWISGTRLRIRVDGDLRGMDRYQISKRRLAHIVRVAKVKSGLDIAETRRAQGGQFETAISGQTYFVRVQTQPTVHGENVVMRLLPQDAELQSVEKLGFSPETQERYRRLLRNPGGLVLVVGPTGSGKTTTLYAGLRMLVSDPSRKVITIEDPVEYACEGAQQVTVSREVGFGFADAMRSFVRQDPDVILLGEVRDPETAREAIRASQTGHLVLTTLHCNDAVDAVQRLLDLGMSPNSISSELLAVFAQRLAKKICDSCRESVPLDAETAAEVFPEGPPADFEAFAGRGCDACDGLGTFGRTAVVEYLPMNVALRSAIAAGAAVEDLRELARAAGLISLRDRALELVKTGIIGFDTLPRFIPLDRLVPPE